MESVLDLRTAHSVLDGLFAILHCVQSVLDLEFAHAVPQTLFSSFHAEPDAAHELPPDEPLKENQPGLYLQSLLPSSETDASFHSAEVFGLQGREVD